MDSNWRPRFDKWNEIRFGPSRIGECMEFWSYVIFGRLGLTFQNQFKIPKVALGREGKVGREENKRIFLGSFNEFLISISPILNHNNMTPCPPYCVN
jgi:hypothetical protein